MALQNLGTTTYGKSPAQLCASQQQIAEQNAALNKTSSQVDAVIQALNASANDPQNKNVSPTLKQDINQLQSAMKAQKSELSSTQTALQSQINAAGGCSATTTLLTSTTQPSSTKPSTTQPSTTQPSTTQPSTTQPSTTQPSTTQPSTTQPSTTQPSTTQPSTTQPSTTQPSTTQPSTSEPTTPSCCVTTVSPTFCNTYHICDNANPYTYIPDPDDCGVYFYCTGSTNWERIICNPGLKAVYYSSYSVDCEADPQHTCISAAQQTMNDTNYCPETPDPMPTPIAVPGDCNSDYFCNDIAKVQSCYSISILPICDTNSTVSP